MPPIKYTVKLISSRSGSGKTYVGTRLVGYLKKKGYSVGVVKHCAHGLVIEGKDSSEYLDAGADVVAASSADILITYVKPWVDDLRKVLEFVETPIVVVEGFKASGIGDNVGVLRNVDELNELMSNGIKLDAVLSDGREVLKEASNKGLQAFSFKGLEAFFRWVEEKALNTVKGSLPGKDCGACGYSSCEAFAAAYLKGVNAHCVNTTLNVRVFVDRNELQLNPFVERLIASVIEGLISPLKNVPVRRSRVSVEITYGRNQAY